VTERLTTQNATITTATIQIRTLTIGKKQVTLAVFRQLEDADIIKTLDADLAGEPWGRVNYHPDKCADAKEHIHVVWQQGDELRRATVYAPSVAAHRNPYAGLYVQALIADGRRYHLEDRPADHLQVIRGRPGEESGFARFTYRGVHFHGPVRDDFVRAYQHLAQAPSVEDMWHHIRHVAGPDATTDSIAGRLPALAYTTSWRRLKELPQLFIAV
jgi:hypothetical protein